MNRVRTHFETFEDRRLLAAFTSEEAAWQIRTPAYTLFAYDRPLSVSDKRRELWRTDGTARGTRYLGTLDAAHDPFAHAHAASAFEERTAISVHTTRLASGRDVFTASFKTGYNAYRFELWATDGTLGGTRPLFGDTPVTLPVQWTEWGNFDGVLYAVGSDRVGYPSVAWRTDGTVEGTRSLPFSAFSGGVVGIGRDTYTIRAGPRVTLPNGSPTYDGFDVYRYVNASGPPILYDSVRYSDEQLAASDWYRTVSLDIIDGHLVARGGSFAFQIDGTPEPLALGAGPYQISVTPLPDRNAIGPAEAMVLSPRDGAGAPVFTQGTPATTWTLPGLPADQYGWEFALDSTTVYAFGGSGLFAVDRATRRLRWQEQLVNPLPPGIEYADISNFRQRGGALFVDQGWQQYDPDINYWVSKRRTLRRVSAGQWAVAADPDASPLDTFGELPRPGDLGKVYARAFADLNDNGRRDVGETWLDGTVALTRVSVLAGTDRGTGYASSLGEFARFNELPVGAYRASFFAQERSAAPLIDPLRPAKAGAVRVDVAGGRTTSIAIPVRVAPAGAGVISVNVFVDLNRDGKPDSPRRGGIDEQGDPTSVDWRYAGDPGAVVLLQRFVDGKRAGSTAQAWQYDEPIRFDRLPAGRYFVQLNLDGFYLDGVKMPVAPSGRSSYWIDVPVGASERTVDLGFWKSAGSRIIRRLVKDYNNNGRRDGDDALEVHPVIPRYRVDPATGQRDLLPLSVRNGTDPLLPGEYIIKLPDAPERRITVRENVDIVYDEIVPYGRIDATPFLDRNRNGRQDAGENASTLVYGYYDWSDPSLYWMNRSGYFSGSGLILLEYARPRFSPASILRLSASSYIDGQYEGSFEATVAAPFRMNGIQRIVVPLQLRS
jgi:hypothetical protein